MAGMRGFCSCHVDTVRDRIVRLSICDHTCKTRNHRREHHHKSDVIDRYLAGLDQAESR